VNKGNGTDPAVIDFSSYKTFRKIATLDQRRLNHPKKTIVTRRLKLLHRFA
jgi:hypothetical protein